MALTGRETIVGITGGTTWHTAVLLGASTGLLPSSIDPVVLGVTHALDNSIGFNDIECAEKIEEVCEPAIIVPVRREGQHWKFWAHIFGGDTISGAGPFTHTFNWATETALFYTMGVELGNADRLEWPSVKVTNVTLQKNSDEYFEFSVSNIGDTIVRGSEGSNGASEYDAVTYISRCLRIPFRDVQLRMNVDSAGALASGDNFQARDLSVSITRPFEKNLRGQQGAIDGTETRTEEPFQNAASEILLSFEEPFYANLEDFDRAKDEVNQKARIDLNRTVVTAFTFFIEFPNLLPITPEAAIENGARVPFVHNLMALKAASTPTGFTNVNMIHSVVDDGFNTSYD